MSGCRLVTIVSVMLLVSAGQTLAGRTERVSETISAEEAERLDIELDFGVGEIEISPADMEEAAELDIFYTPRWVRYDIDYSKRGEIGYLYLESSHRRRSGHSDSENEWQLTLSNRYRTSLQMDIGAAEVSIDLGGIPVTEISLDVGATSGVMEFSHPNPERMREFDADVGASSLDFLDLGNAHVDRMNFSCGAASCVLDFRGDFRGETELDLEVGVGSVDIVVPRGLAVRVEGDDSWFSSLDFHGLKLREVRDDVWETPGFDDANDRLTIQVDIGIGSVDIYSRR